ncbi:MAG TPA: ABC transporter substrate-binding protein [Geobacteraceae bacterium]
MVINFVRCVILAVLGVLLASASGVGAGSFPSAVPKSGGTLTVAVDLEFRGFDPLKVAYLQLGDRSVMMAVEEKLFDMDAKGRLIPGLALAATPGEGGKSWTIKLRQGVSFHDGTPFNADAVVAHWARMLDPDNRFSGAALIEPIQSVTKIDDATVRFALKHPWAAFLAMLSETRWTGAYIPSPKAVRDNTLNRAPVGTGPFVFKEWRHSDHLVVVKNPDYWRSGKPRLDAVVFRPIVDAEARFAALGSGETDIILTDRGVHILRAKKDPSLRVYSTDATGPYTFIINTAEPPLKDVRVRRALAHAWNQELYLKSDYLGTLPSARSPFGETLDCGECGYRRYDPVRARKLLDENGKKIVLELLETDTPLGREAGEVMQRLFSDIGVTLKVTLLAEGELVKRVKSGDYQIAGWRLMDLDDMGPYLDVCLHSSGKFNFSRYRNPVMDELLVTQQTATDERVRQKALCGVATLINEDVIYLYGGRRRYYAIAKAGIQGLGAFDDGIVPVVDVWVKGEGQQGAK